MTMRFFLYDIMIDIKYVNQYIKLVKQITLMKLEGKQQIIVFLCLLWWKWKYKIYQYYR